MRKRFYAAFFLLLITLMLPSGVFANELPQLSDVYDDYLQATKDKAAAQQSLKNLNSKANATEKQINDLTSKIRQAEQDLSRKQAAYANALLEVDRMRLAIDAKQKELQGRQETLRSRTKATYVTGGDVGLMEVFFQSATLADFLSRMEYMNRIVDNDQKILSDVRTQKASLEQEKISLEAKASEADRLKKDAEATKRYLDQSKSQKAAALDEIHKDQDALMVQIEKLEKDSKALEAEIRRLQQQNTSGVSGSIALWPTPGCYYITSPFSIRKHPITGEVKQHTGVDIGAANKSQILAAGSGTVILAGWYGAYGNAVIIDHGNGLSSLYGHMSTIGASLGKTVSAGDLIGYVGSTGYSTGPHLHFEIRKDGVAVNPMSYF